MEVHVCVNMCICIHVEERDREKEIGKQEGEQFEIK